MLIKNEISNVANNLALSLKSSIEPNKYQAITNLAAKAGIKIPSKSQYLLSSHQDGHLYQEFDFLNKDLFDQLTEYYIHLSKLNLAKKLHYNGELLDEAFRTFDFQNLKELFSGNVELAKITDENAAYYMVIGKAISILNNDFMLEVLTINGLRPDPLVINNDSDFIDLSRDILKNAKPSNFVTSDDNSLIIYRGINIENFTDIDADYFFKFGHKFSSIENRDYNLLDFYLNTPWNKADSLWNYGGQYFSMSPNVAVYFNSLNNGTALVFEAIANHHTPKVCTHKTGVISEFIQSSLDVEGIEIKAIYVLDYDPKILHDFEEFKKNDPNSEAATINIPKNLIKTVYLNPYIEKTTVASFAQNDVIPFLITKYPNMMLCICFLRPLWITHS